MNEDYDLFINIINKEREDASLKENSELNGTEFIKGPSKDFLIKMRVNIGQFEKEDVIYTLGLN